MTVLSHFSKTYYSSLVSSVDAFFGFQLIMMDNGLFLFLLGKMFFCFEVQVYVDRNVIWYTISANSYDFRIYIHFWGGCGEKEDLFLWHDTEI